MKINNMIRRAALAAILITGLAACDTDIEPVYVQPGGDIALGGASSDIILTPENPLGLALSLYWSGDGRLALSDTLLQAPVDAAVEAIQLSADEQFSNPLEINVEKGVRSRQFLNEEFNSLLGRLGYEADVLSPLFIRISSVLAANIEPSYSKVLKVNVQTYKIHLDLGTVLDKDWNETAMKLASPEENGIYQGFMGVSGWYNWWFRENNNMVWGNVGESGKTFHASAADDHWNFWFPDPSGCYFTTVNTVEGWWSALHIDNLTVGGDITGEMEFNTKTNQWFMPVNLGSAAAVNITISGKGSLYDKTTTDMGPAMERNVAFGGSADNLVFGENGTTITVSLPAGETMLVLDLTDPMAFKVGAGEAAPTPETPQRLFLSGTVNWDFADYLTLYDESALAYGGAHWIDSEWGYRAYPDEAWEPAYKAGEGSTALSGTIIPAESDGNFPAPEKGLYVMDFKLGDMTYSLTKIETVTFTGINDDWSEREMTQSTDNPEVFTAEFVKEKETPWGVKVLINHDWSMFFGGGSGTLRLGHSDATTGFDGDNDLTGGKTYILTVDLGTQTYSYSEKQ